MSEPQQATDKEFAAHFRDPDGHLLSIFGPKAMHNPAILSVMDRFQQLWVYY